MDSEQFDLTCFIQNLIKFLINDSSFANQSPQNIHDYFSNSKISLNYNARSHNRQMENTHNVSKNMAKSCSGFDEICDKIRECLHDAQCLDVNTSDLHMFLSSILESSMYVFY